MTRPFFGVLHDSPMHSHDQDDQEWKACLRDAIQGAVVIGIVTATTRTRSIRIIRGVVERSRVALKQTHPHDGAELRS